MAVTPQRHPRRAAKSLVAAGFAATLIGGASMVPAAAADEASSYASARFLSGSVLGFNLDEIVKLHGAEAAHTGDGAPVTEGNPLKVDLLGTEVIDIDGGIQIKTLGDFLELGLVNQYATAGPSGAAGAGTGALADNGAIGTGVPANYPGTAKLDLSALLGPEFTDNVADVDLIAEAIQATARVNPQTGESSTGYSIAGLKLRLALPVLSSLPTELTSSISGLGGCTLGAGTFLEINTCDTTVVLDLYKLADGTLNGMPPNTSVLSDEVLGELTSRLTAHVGVLLDDLLGGVGATDALTSLTQTTGLTSLTDQLVDPVVEALSGLEDVISIKLNVQGDERETPAGSLGEFLGGVGTLNSGFLSAPVSPEPSDCLAAGVTALQVKVLNGDGAVINLAAADAVGCAAADDDDEGDEGGDGGAEDGAEDGGAEDGAEDGGGVSGGGGGTLPDTGAAPGWLLPVGLALMVGGGAGVYLNRRGRATV